MTALSTYSCKLEQTEETVKELEWLFISLITQRQGQTLVKVLDEEEKLKQDWEIPNKYKWGILPHKVFHWILAPDRKTV